MVSVFEFINPIYFLPIGAFFIILLGCVCYGCYDLFNPTVEATDAYGRGVVACDISDCPIPGIHEQHKRGSSGYYSRKAWGLPDSSENSTANPAGDYSILMYPLPYADFRFGSNATDQYNLGPSSVHVDIGGCGCGDMGGGDGGGGD